MSKAAWPVDANLTDRLAGLGLALPSGVAATDMIQSAIDDWEQDSLWTPFLADTAETVQTYDPTGGFIFRLPQPYISISQVKFGASVLAIGSEVYLQPTGAIQRGRPFTKLEFVYRLELGVADPNAIEVTGKKGYAEQIPTTVWNAVLDRAVWHSFLKIQNAPGFLEKIEQDSVKLTFQKSPGQTVMDKLDENYRVVVNNFVRRG